MAIPFFNQAQDDAHWSLTVLKRPWPNDRISILEFVRNTMASDLEANGELPDEEWLTDMRSIKFAPGVFDRMMRVNDTPEEAHAQANAVVHAVQALSSNSSDRNLARLYAEITRRRMSEVLRIMNDLLTEATFSRPHRVRAIAMLLARESPDRDAVKTAMLLLGKSGIDRDDAADIQVIGSHGEFSRFAADALRGSVDGWQQIAWEMARRTTGAGRSAAVAALEGAAEPQIRQWLLEEGWRDNSYDDGAAFVCATTGGLETALREGTISLEAAGGLLRSLSAAEIYHHPGLRLLPNGPEVVERFMRDMAGSGQALWQFQIARSMHLFVASKYQGWEEKPAPGWTPEVRARIADICAQILRLPGWEDMVREALLNSNPDERKDAYVVAHPRGMDLWDHWWGLAQSDPGFKEWGRLTFRLNEERIDAFVALAAERLKPGSKPGVESLASSMSPFPGKGWHFVRAAIWSDNDLYSTMGLRTMGEWGVENWTTEMRAELEGAAQRHPEAHTREFALEILRGDWHPQEGFPFDDEPEVWEI